MAALVGNRYRLLQRLGAGGMGEVHLAEDTWRGGAQVALKAAAVASPEGAALEAEFGRLHRLKHPNVVAAHDLGTCPRRRWLYYTMDRVEGRPLLEAARDLEPRARAVLLAQAASALAFVHARGVVHGDLKPENVIVAPPAPGAAEPGQAMLLDFGLSGGVGAAAVDSRGAAGTLSHAAPEVLSRAAAPGIASDLYAFGILAHEVLAGRPPFPPDEPAATIRRHLEEPAPRLGLACPGLPAAAGRLVDSLLAKDPGQRPVSARAVAEALAAAFDIDPAESIESLAAHARAPEPAGNAAVRAALSDLVARAAAPAAPGPRAVLVAGPPGSGRGRLLGELPARAAPHRVQVLSVAGAGWGPHGGMAGLAAAAARQLGRDDPDVIRLLPELLKLDPTLPAPPGVGASAPLPLADERARLGRAVFTVLARAAREQPALVVIDDAAALPEEGARLLAYLVRQLGRQESPVPLAIVAAAPTPPPLDLAVAFGWRGAVLEVAPLAAAEIVELVRGLLPGLAAAEAVGQRLHAGVGGLPGLAEAWLEALIRRRAITPTATGWVADLRHPEFAAPPADARAAVAEAVAGLSPEAGCLLLVLALAPSPLTPAALRRAAGLTAAERAPAVERLARLDLARHAATPAGSSWQVGSDLVRETALAAATAADLAARARGLLEAIADSAPPAERAVVAERAGQGAEAALLLEAALASASKRRDSVAVADLGRRLAAVSEGRRRRAALLQAAAALVTMDRAEAAAAALDEAEEVGGGDASPGTVDELESDAGVGEQLRVRILIAMHRPDEAVERATQLLDRLPRDHPLRRAVEVDLARAASAAGRKDAAALAEALVVSAGRPDERLDALQVRGTLRLREGQHEAAASDLAVASRLAEDAGESARAGSIANNLGVAALASGRPLAAVRHLMEAARLRERAGALGSVAGTYANLGLVELDRGRPGVAAGHLARALALHEELGDEHGQAASRTNLAVAALRQENLAVAREQAEAALALLEGRSDALLRAAYLSVHAAVDLQVGDAAAAVARAREVVREADGGGLPAEQWVAASLVAAEGLALLDRTEEAAAAAAAIADRPELPVHVRAEAFAVASEALSGGSRAWTTPPGAAPFDRDRARRSVALAEAALALLPHRGGAATAAVRLRAALALAAAHAVEHATGQAPAALAAASRALARADEAARDVRRRSARVDLDLGWGWLLARRERHGEAAKRFASALRRLRAWLPKVPAGERPAFLADARRQGARAALVEARQAALRAAAAGAFFDVLPPLPTRPVAGAPAADLAAVRRQVERLREVLAIGRGLNTLVPVGELLQRVLDSALRFTRAERAFIVLGDPESLEFAAARDRGGSAVPQASFHVSRGVLSEVIRTKRPVLTSDARADRRFTQQASVLHLNLQSILVAPLVAQDEVIGALYVDDPRRAGAFGAEDLDLLVLFASQAAVAVENARLHATRVQKELLDQDLALARHIQQGLLPRTLPELPGFDLAATMQPAREVGGDYHDVLAVEGGGVRLVVGDVSGKGVPASLFMVMARTVLRLAGSRREPLDQVLRRVNGLLHGEIEESQFLSLLLLEPTAGGGPVRACLAGHDPPLAWRAGSGQVESLPEGGIVLGPFPDVGDRLVETSIPMAPGDVLCCFTDGVTECRSPSGELFGRARLAEALAEAGPRGAAAVLECVLADLDRFRAGTERSDDVTLLILGAR